MGMFGGVEWILILFVLFLLFGAKRIPGLAWGIGEAIKEFCETRKDIKDEITVGA